MLFNSKHFKSQIPFSSLFLCKISSQFVFARFIAISFDVSGFQHKFGNFVPCRGEIVFLKEKTTAEVSHLKIQNEILMAFERCYKDNSKTSH